LTTELGYLLTRTILILTMTLLQPKSVHLVGGNWFAVIHAVTDCWSHVIEDQFDFCGLAVLITKTATDVMTTFLENLGIHGGSGWCQEIKEMSGKISGKFRERCKSWKISVLVWWSYS